MDGWPNRDAIAAWGAAVDHLDDWGDEGDFTRQQLLNPTLFALLGPVTGRTILDAGCGHGYLCRLLAKRGAHVTGVEPAGPLFQLAVDHEVRETLGIRYLQADLSTAHLPSGFDAVVANMVFMDIPDDVAAIRRCSAALAPGGDFVVSLTHPCFEAASADWAATRCVEVCGYLAPYTKQQAYAPGFHRPLSHYLNTIIDAGCVIRCVVEPALDAQWRAHGPAYERNIKVPSVIVIHATKA